MLRSPESDYVWEVWGGVGKWHQIPSDNPESNYVWRNINGESGDWSSSWYILDYANWKIPYIHEESLMFYDLLRNNGYLKGIKFDAEDLIKRQKYLNERALAELPVPGQWNRFPSEEYGQEYGQQMGIIDNYLRERESIRSWENIIDSEHQKWAYATSFLLWLKADNHYNCGDGNKAWDEYQNTIFDISHRQKSFELPGNILIPLTLCKQEAGLVKDTPNARGRWSRDIKREQEEGADRWKYAQAELAKKNLEQASKPIQPQTSSVKPSSSLAPYRRGLPEPVGIWRSPYFRTPDPTGARPSWKVPPCPPTFQGL